MKRILRDYAFGWVMLGLAVAFMVTHFVSGLQPFADEQAHQGKTFSWDEYLVTYIRDTVENAQSEAWQLLAQVALLKWLLFRGSPQSSEGDDRREAKLDALLRRIAPDDAGRVIADLDGRYGRG